MQDQVAAAVARGIPAAGLHSSLEEAEKEEIWASLRAGTLRLLYASPERLSRLAPQLHEQGIRPTLLAIDEAHCVTEWGHDFRPSYRTLGASRHKLGRPPCLALTGSATPEVRADIASVMRFRPGRFAVHLGSFDRSNLWFGVVRVRSERDRLRALLGLVGGDDHMVIVYAPTRGLTESVARALAGAGHRAVPYHAGLPKARRAATLRDFLEDRVDVIVATCAFGMGIDKADVRLVVHWTFPATPEAYYQEAGRAGRDGAFARCALLWRQGDEELHRRQLDVTFPPHAVLEKLWNQEETRGVAEMSGRRPSVSGASSGPSLDPSIGVGCGSGAAGRRRALRRSKHMPREEGAGVAPSSATSASASSGAPGAIDAVLLERLPLSIRLWPRASARSAARLEAGAGPGVAPCSSPTCCSGWRSGHRPASRSSRKSPALERPWPGASEVRFSVHSVPVLSQVG